MEKEIVIALYDSNKEYVESLSDYLKEEEDTSYSFLLFTDASVLDEYCKKHCVNVIVIAEYLIAENAILAGERMEEDNVVLLVEDENVKFINNISTVYRYQAAGLLISSILNICAEKMISKNKNIAKYQKVQNKFLVSIYSPIGRCGKTRLSIQLGVELSKSGYKVLLINFEEFSLLMKYLKGEEREDLSDLLYYFLSGAHSFKIKADAIIRNYKGMDYIPPVRFVPDLRKIEHSVWKEFVDTLGKEKEYDIILFDLSDMLENVFKMLEYSDFIIVPTIHNEECEYKIEKFFSFIKDSEYEVVLNDICKINMSDIQKGDNRSEVEKLIVKIVEGMERRKEHLC